MVFNQLLTWALQELSYHDEHANFLLQACLRSCSTSKQSSHKPGAIRGDLFSGQPLDMRQAVLGYMIPAAGLSPWSVQLILLIMHVHNCLIVYLTLHRTCMLIVGLTDDDKKETVKCQRDIRGQSGQNKRSCCKSISKLKRMKRVSKKIITTL